ncbi:MAG TPA: alanine racemase [Nevskiaceae bacterium]|nr:alanine racemase [Nevskiaceae bacterium]
MRPAFARIDTTALRHNYLLARGAKKALAVIKADAYGHGAVACARALAGVADGFAVACIEEAITLREAGIERPILLLEGFFEASELPLIERYALWTAVGSPEQVKALAQYQAAMPLTVWLLLDSGMHRLGLDTTAFRAAFAQLSAAPQVGEIVFMTHMARADELACTRTDEQWRNFGAATAGLKAPTSLSNSASTLGWPVVASDWMRPGLMLYGVNPFHPQPTDAAKQLRPVMTLASRIMAVREIGVGEPVGYGGDFVAPRPTRVGVVALGYADGYPRRAPNGTPVSIGGQPGRLIGRVSMDMITVDLTDHPDAGVGTEVVLWGSSPTVAEVAAACHMSPYQLLCNVKRVPYRYVDA